MNEIVWSDPVSQKTVIHHPARMGVRVSGVCPFCPGSEELTTAELSRRGGEEWGARSVTNLYPLVDPERHEVVVLSRRHRTRVQDLSFAELTTGVDLWAERIREMGEKSVEVVAFLNQGVLGGASQPHLHAQVVGLAEESPVAESERRAAEEGCHLCEERLTRAGGILGGEWVSAGEHGAEVRGEWLLERVQALLMAARWEGDLNLIVHQGAHPHVHLLPRRASIAGFDLGTGLVTSLEGPEA